MSAADGGLSVGASTSAASVPAWVRASSPLVQREFALGQAFEQQLLGELTRQAEPEAQGAGEGGEEGAAPGGPTQTLISSLVPQALAGAVAGGRGLGIAEELTRELSARSGDAVKQTGGTGS